MVDQSGRESLDVAYHEAGHAVVARALGLAVTLVELYPEAPPGHEGLKGHVVTAELERFRNVDPADPLSSSPEYKEFLERDLIQRMAGIPAALRQAGARMEQIDVPGFKDSEGAGGDFWAAWKVANIMARYDLGPDASVSQCQRSAEERVAEALSRAIVLVGRQWDDVGRVARELRARRSIGPDTFERILSG